MRRGGMSGADAVETINAASIAIASAGNRVAQASAQKRKWGSWWSLYWCFGSYKNNNRIGHALLVPETSTAGADVATAEHQSWPPSMVLPFIAPPSSPASFLPSEPPSSAQSPSGLFFLTSTAADMYSTGGASSIFAIGPYAHETQLVSPPVFSNFATEPSTAPCTPPPESVHLTTPSSPEVPFALLLEPNLQNGEARQKYHFSQYEFQSYQLQPGSPASHLISPRSVISGSGTSSPFPECEFANELPLLLEFSTGSPPKLFDREKIELCEKESHEGCGEVTLGTAGLRSCSGCFSNSQDSDVAPLPDTRTGLRNDEIANDHRVSLGITAQEIRCGEKRPVTLPKAVPESVENTEHTGQEKAVSMGNPIGETSNDTSEKAPTDGDNGLRHQKNRTSTLGSVKEFNFEYMDGENSDEPNVALDWWANEMVLGEDGGPRKNWSFFPMVQTGAS